MFFRRKKKKVKIPNNPFGNICAETYKKYLNEENETLINEAKEIGSDVFLNEMKVFRAYLPDDRVKQGIGWLSARLGGYNDVDLWNELFDGIIYGAAIVWVLIWCRKLEEGEKETVWELFEKFKKSAHSSQDMAESQDLKSERLKLPSHLEESFIEMGIYFCEVVYWEFEYSKKMLNPDEGEPVGEKYWEKNILPYNGTTDRVEIDSYGQ